MEDKVAALEEKNVTAQQENASLREIVSRLQSENMRLRQSSFTFSVLPSSSPVASTSQQKEAGPSRATSGSTDAQRDSTVNLFGSPPSSTTSSTASTHDSPESIFANENNEGRLPFLGQNLFTFNNSGQQQTATSDAMNLDLGFGPVVTHTPYTTIASNPLFMSFREPDMFDSFGSQSQDGNGQSQNHGGVSQNGQSFDFSSQNLFSGWPDVSMNGVGPNSMQAFDLTNSLDELFGAYNNNNNNGSGTGLDYSINAAKASPPNSISPVAHQKASPEASSSTSSSSPPSSNSPPSATDSPSIPCSDKKKCTKQAIKNFIARDGGSIFAPSKNPTTSSTPLSEESGDADSCDEFPPCKGLVLPKTQKSEKNVEVMTAWRNIRTDPKFQDADINQLCSEFASKARCDGCHVVIEPEGMQEILESVQNQKRAKQQSRLFSASEALVAGFGGAGTGTGGSPVNSIANPLNK